jgi:hypothetical protein
MTPVGLVELSQMYEYNQFTITNVSEFPLKHLRRNHQWDHFKKLKISIV